MRYRFKCISWRTVRSSMGPILIFFTSKSLLHKIEPLLRVLFAGTLFLRTKYNTNQKSSKSVYIFYVMIRTFRYPLVCVLRMEAMERSCQKFLVGRFFIRALGCFATICHNYQILPHLPVQALENQRPVISAKTKHFQPSFSLVSGCLRWL